METAPTTAPRHRTLDELQTTLPDIRLAPEDDGTLHLIVRRPGIGAREVLDDAELAPAEGLVGDSWLARASARSADPAPQPDTQITLMSIRAIRAVSDDTARWPLAGDQLFVDLDLTYRNLPPGTQLHVGEALLEVSEQLHTGCAKFVERFGLDAMKWVNSPVGRELNLRGIYARVVTGGRIRPGDTIVKALR